MAGSDNPSMVVVMLTPVVMEYCQGTNPKVGAPLAQAFHTWGRELFLQAANSVIIPTTLSNLASQHLNALNLLGRSEDVLYFSGDYIPFFESLPEPENLPTLRVARINALIELKRIDEAEQELHDPKLVGNWSTNMEIERLKNLVERLKTDITSLKPAKESGTPPSDQDMMNILKNVITQGVDDPVQRQVLLDATENVDPTNRIDPNTKEGFSQLNDLLRMGEKFITKNSSENSEWTVKGRIREASELFVLEEKPPPEKIHASKNILEESLEWSKANGKTDLINSAVWGLYLCYSRLGDSSQAADQLLALRANLEETRTNIQDPFKRGGVFSDYPHLFNALCDHLQRVGRTRELLEAIEASKGRGVADILTKRSGSPVFDANIYEAVTNLPSLTQAHNFHYITYFVDDNQVYAVLVTKKGALYASDPLLISKSELRELSLNVNPKKWGQLSDFDPSVQIEDVSEKLAPLVAWLGPLINQGILEANDHIVYSADDNFHNVPLHYLLLAGVPLIEMFSISRIQNAHHLKQVLEQPVNRPNKGYLGVVVPTAENTKRPDWDTFRNNLFRPIHFLHRYWPEKGAVLENTQATKDSLAHEKRKQQVLHFSTHGIFPEKRKDISPFTESGLLLASDDRLPEEKASGRDAHLLSPAEVLNTKLDVEGSHISLMACISGLSREGLGGDALGLEWSFIQAGASSLVGSHWLISAKLAADFFELFYHNWLYKEHSRAHAYRFAVLALRRADKNPFGWAAFSLGGDWR